MRSTCWNGRTDVVLAPSGEAAAVRLTAAAAGELPTVVALINRAYRGRGTARGWNGEVAYIEGDRTSEARLREELAGATGASLLLWRRADGSLRGCVWLAPEAEGAWHLGSLAVDPGEQGAGLGRRLLRAAEDHVHALGGREVRIRVVNVRSALLAWYARRGYAVTGEIEAFPYDDDRVGRPLRDDLSLVVLRKALA